MVAFYLKGICVSFTDKYLYALRIRVNWDAALMKNMYFDKVLLMGCRSSCFIAQRVTNAFQFILQNKRVNCVSYLDDLGGADTPDAAWNAFEKWVNFWKICMCKNLSQKHAV